MTITLSNFYTLVGINVSLVNDVNEEVKSRHKALCTGKEMENILNDCQKSNVFDLKTHNYFSKKSEEIQNPLRYGLIDKLVYVSAGLSGHQNTIFFNFDQFNKLERKVTIYEDATYS